MGNYLQDTKKSAKQMAIDMAKRTVKEPLEIITEAKEQVMPSVGINRENKGVESPADDDKRNGDRQAENISQNDLSRIKDLEAEAKKISLDDLIADLQQKIVNGEDVYLENYPQIPIDQKQVLKAQIEAVRARKENDEAEKKNISEPSTRRSRRLAGAVRGMKQKVEQLKTKTETRMPPSG